VSTEKWAKGKHLITDLWNIIEAAGAGCEGDDLSNVKLDYKTLEITRGFLVHLSMTFDMVTHHL
jgi:hypothetical protein